MPMGRPQGQRSDGRRNRETILAAAAEVFADKGFDAPFYEVARRAGVGQGTLYRHFPDRDALALALFERNVTLLEELAEQLADSGTAFEVLLETIVEQQIAGAGPAASLLGGGRHPHVEEHAQRVVRVFEAPIRRAVTAGRLRPDFEPRDVLVVLAMVFGVATLKPADTLEALTNARALELVYAGIRGEAWSPRPA